MAFRFKQFSVNDDQSSMKVGTDAVLLGAWAGINDPDNILDIGTGSGLIALMMAQRFQTGNIQAIDIHLPSIIQSKENFNHSPWKNRLSASHISLQEFASDNKTKYDLVVSNPPYFTNSLLPPDPSKKLARHTASLSYLEIVQGLCKVMDADGCFCLILPYENLDLFEIHANENGLYKSRQLNIIPVKGRKPNRLLSEWRFKPSVTKTDSLTIRSDIHTYSEEYKRFTGDFYLASL